MAVPISFITLILRLETIEQRYPGGLTAFRVHAGGSFATDDHLAAIGFMSSADADRFLAVLQGFGLTILRDGRYQDVAVADMLSGLKGRCDWLHVERTPSAITAWLRGAEPGPVAERAGDLERRLEPGPAGRSLRGLAIGDCLGGGVEGTPAEFLALRGPIREFAHDPMVWTDDTQQAMTLVEATVRFGYPEPRWVADRWVQMRARRLHRGTGRGFRGSIEEYARTGDPRSSGRTDRAGNGAAMRIGPIAVALRDRPESEWVPQLVDVSLITHRELRALSGMLAVAFVAQRLASLSWFPPKREVAREILTDLVGWLHAAESKLARDHRDLGGRRRKHEVSGAFDRIDRRWGEPWDAIVQEIEAYASACRGEPTRIGEGFVTASVVTAVAWTLWTLAMMPETLVSAVGFGDDADTMGAMVGAMAGSATPRHAIPDRWWRMAGREELEAWGRALDLGTAEGTLPDLIGLEERLTRIVRG